MEEPTKQLRENLEKISKTCSDIISPKSIVMNCGRMPQKTSTLNMLNNILRMQRDLEDSGVKEPLKIVLASPNSGSIIHWDYITQILKSLDIKVELINVGNLSVSPTINFRELQRPYLEPLIVTNPYQREIFILTPEKHIPIKGKSSKKGKNNQYGSKFHK